MTDKFTATELLSCVKRELGWRRYVYPNRVAEGRLDQAKADREISMMEEIATHYEELASKERLL